MFFFGELGHFAHLNEVIASTPDSRGYLNISRFIVGVNESVDEKLVSKRPFFFPVYLSVKVLFGEWFYFICQLSLNIGSICFVYTTIRRLTGTLSFALAGSILLILHPTFTFIAPHALSETLSFFLLSLSFFCIARFFQASSLLYSFIGLFVLALATTTRPIFIIVFFLWLVFFTAKLVSERKFQ
jgi:4-amino-4-deoxy-L-arabinose transferase-like glycosyltransferase